MPRNITVKLLGDEYENHWIDNQVYRLCAILSGLSPKYRICNT